MESASARTCSWDGVNVFVVLVLAARIIFTINCNSSTMLAVASVESEWGGRRDEGLETAVVGVSNETSFPFRQTWALADCSFVLLSHRALSLPWRKFAHPPAMRGVQFTGRTCLWLS